MILKSENVPVVLGAGSQDDVRMLGPTDQGEVAIRVVHEGRRVTILASPEEAEQLGVALVKAAVVAHIKRRAGQNGASVLR